MSIDESPLGKIQEVRTVEDIEQVNEGLSKGWVILIITEETTVWDDGVKVVVLLIIWENQRYYLSDTGYLNKTFQ